MPPARIVLWVASVAGIALLVRSLWIGPVPFWLAGTAFFLYFVFCTLGVIFPQLEMYGDVILRGEPGQRRVGLTFDDGPYPPTTRRVLELLNERGQKATFFVLGEKARRFPDLLAEMVAAGHEIAIHGYRHDRLFSLRPPRYVQHEIERCSEVVERATGKRPRWFRPPVGHVGPRTAAGAKRAGVEIVAWSVRGFDGLKGREPDAVLARVEPGLSDGAIVLLHDAAENDDHEPASLEALPGILDCLAERGLEAVTLSQLLDEAEEPETTDVKDDVRAAQRQETAS